MVTNHAGLEELLGGKDKDDQGNPKPTDKNAMTGMALLCYLGHCELQDSPDYGSTVQKAINYITSILRSQKLMVVLDLTLIQYAPMLFVKLIP